MLRTFYNPLQDAHFCMFVVLNRLRNKIFENILDVLMLRRFMYEGNEKQLNIS